MNSTENIKVIVKEGKIQQVIVFFQIQAEIRARIAMNIKIL